LSYVLVTGGLAICRCNGLMIIRLRRAFLQAESRPHRLASTSCGQYRDITRSVLPPSGAGASSHVRISRCAETLACRPCGPAGGQWFLRAVTGAVSALRLYSFLATEPLVASTGPCGDKVWREKAGVPEAFCVSSISAVTAATSLCNCPIMLRRAIRY
jgi:hypothetical protein